MSKTDKDYPEDRFDRLEQRLDKSFEKIDRRFEQIDQRFEKIDQRFEKIDQRFEQVDRQFDKLTATMLKGFDRVDKELAEKADKADVGRLFDALDSMIKRQEICDQERLVINHQLERHDGWSHELAGKIGHKLSSA